MVRKTKMIKRTLAAQPTPIGQIGGKPGSGLGPWSNLGNIGDISESAGIFTKIISNIIGVMTIIAGIWFIFQFIIGAYGFLSAGGDQKKVASAQQQITNALLGLVIVIAAYAIIYIVGEILGFRILHPEELIINLRPSG